MIGVSWIYVIVARYSDGSDEPTLIRAFEHDRDAKIALAMIELSQPMRNCKIHTVPVGSTLEE